MLWKLFKWVNYLFFLFLTAKGWKEINRTYDHLLYACKVDISMNSHEPSRPSRRLLFQELCFWSLNWTNIVLLIFNHNPKGTDRKAIHLAMAVAASVIVGKLTSEALIRNAETLFRRQQISELAHHLFMEEAFNFERGEYLDISD